MAGYKFDYETKVWGGEKLRMRPIHFRASRLYYALQEIPNKKAKLLDVGCGVGDFPDAFSVYLPKMEIHAIDISKRAIDLAKKRNQKVHFKVANAEKLPYKDDTFDVVTCFDLIEHVEHPERVIQEIYRVLKPGGVFHTFIPTEDQPVSLEGIFIKAGWTAKEVYGGHPHHFTPGWAKSILTDNGFRIDKTRWGEHLVNQVIELIYFSLLALRRRNAPQSVEGYLGSAKKTPLITLLTLVKNAAAATSYYETRALSWFPGLGIHATCTKT